MARLINLLALTSLVLSFYGYSVEIENSREPAPKSLFMNYVGTWELKDGHGSFQDHQNNSLFRITRLKLDVRAVSANAWYENYSVTFVLHGRSVSDSSESESELHGVSFNISLSKITHFESRYPVTALSTCKDPYGQLVTNRENAGYFFVAPTFHEQISIDHLTTFKNSDSPCSSSRFYQFSLSKGGFFSFFLRRSGLTQPLLLHATASLKKISS